MSKISSLLLAGLLISANALAADSAPSTATPAPGSDLNAQLVAARQQLEVAVREVTRLSSQLGQSAMAGVERLRTRAVLGLQLQTQASAKEQGATIMGVSPGGPAADAGLANGDVIVAINGESTVGPNAPRQVVDHMANVKPDSKVTVKVMRDGKPKEFQVTPRANVAFYMPRGGVAEYIPGPSGPGAEWRGAGPDGPGQHIELHDIGVGVGAIFEGMELADLSPALGQYFGTSKGVLVVRVPRGGEFLKLQDGDVILSIDGRAPENGSHATRILRSYQPGEKIQLKIMRQKKAEELEGTLPELRGFSPRRGANRGPDDRGPGPGERPPGDHPPTD